MNSYNVKNVQINVKLVLSRQNNVKYVLMGRIENLSRITVCARMDIMSLIVIV